MSAPNYVDVSKPPPQSSRPCTTKTRPCGNKSAAATPSFRSPHVTGLRAKQLHRSTLVRLVGTVMPGDHDMLREVSVHPPGEKEPVLVARFEHVEVRVFSHDTKVASFDMHAIRGICSRVDEHMRTAALGNELETHPATLSLGNLFGSTGSLHFGHLRGSIGGTLSLRRRPISRTLLAAAIPHRSNCGDGCQARNHERRDVHRSIQACPLAEPAGRHSPQYPHYQASRETPDSGERRFQSTVAVWNVGVRPESTRVRDTDPPLPRRDRPPALGRATRPHVRNGSYLEPQRPASR